MSEHNPGISWPDEATKRSLEQSLKTHYGPYYHAPAMPQPSTNGEHVVETTAQGGKHAKIEEAFELVPVSVMLRVAKMLKYGAAKYGVGNWRKIERNVNIGRAIRHLYLALADDTTEDHLTNAICRTMFAAAQQEPPDARHHT